MDAFQAQDIAPYHQNHYLFSTGRPDPEHQHRKTADRVHGNRQITTAFLPNTMTTTTTTAEVPPVQFVPELSVVRGKPEIGSKINYSLHTQQHIANRATEVALSFRSTAFIERNYGGITVVGQPQQNLSCFCRFSMIESGKFRCFHCFFCIHQPPPVQCMRCQSISMSYRGTTYVVYYNMFL